MTAEERERLIRSIENDVWFIEGRELSDEYMRELRSLSDKELKEEAEHYSYCLHVLGHGRKDDEY